MQLQIVPLHFATGDFLAFPSFHLRPHHDPHYHHVQLMHPTHLLPQCPPPSPCLLFLRLHDPKTASTATLIPAEDTDHLTSAR